MERLSDDVLQAVLDAHKIFVSIDINTSKVDKYTVSLLEELKMYRGIGTIGECRKAVEKQNPKNPEIYTDTRNGMDLHDRPCSRQVEVYLCLSCGSCIGYVGESLSTYCPNCGQAIRLLRERKNEQD